MESKKERVLTAACILGEGGLLAAQLKSIAHAHNVKLSDRPKKSEIKDTLKVNLTTKTKAATIASDIITTFDQKKKKKKKAAISREPSDVIDSELVDWNVEHKEPTIIQAKEEEEEEAPMPIKKEKKKKKQTQRSQSNSISASQISDSLGIEPITGYIFSAAPRKNMINSLNGGPIDNIPGSNDKCAWLELPALMIMFGTDYQIADWLTLDASLVSSPDYYVLHPEGLVYSTKPNQKLPCHSASMTKSTIQLLDLMNPDHASSALVTAVHKMAKIMSCKGDTIANLAKGAKISVQGHGDWIKLARLIERLTTLADAPELITSLSANQWGISLSNFIVGAFNDPNINGTVFTINVRPCAKANEWLAKYDSNSVDGSLISAWKAINLCLSGQCVQTIETPLRDGTVIPLVIIPGLTPLFSLNLATEDTYKSGSGVTPFWFNPKAMLPYINNVKNAVREYCDHNNAKTMRQSTVMSAALPSSPIMPPATFPKTDNSNTQAFVALTKQPVTLLDLRLPNRSDPTKLAEASTQSLTNPAEMANITHILATALPTKLKRMTKPPNRWIITARLGYNKVTTKCQESADMVFLLNLENARWQVRNWLAAQDSRSDGVELLNHQMTNAKRKRTLDEASVGSLNNIQRFSTKKLKQIGNKLNNLITNAREVGHDAPRYLWNGPLASYCQPRSHSPVFAITTLKDDARVPVEIATVPVGTFMLFGAFGGSTNSTAPDSRPAQCHKAGLMPSYLRGGSFLIQNGADGNHRFQWAWVQTVDSLQMVELTHTTVSSIMTLVLDMGTSADYAMSDSDRDAFNRLASITATIPESEFSQLATALISQGQADAYASNKGNKCLQGCDLIVVNNAYLDRIARRVNGDWYGLIERVLSSVSRYYGLRLDGWFVSKLLERSAPAYSVLFGLLDRDALYTKFFSLGARAPGSGNAITWRIVRKRASDRYTLGASYGVPKDIRKIKRQ